MMHGIAEAAAAGLTLTRSQSRSAQPSARRIRVVGKRTVLAATSEASAAYRVDRTTITALTEDNVRDGLPDFPRSVGACPNLSRAIAWR